MRKSFMIFSAAVFTIALTSFSTIDDSAACEIYADSMIQDHINAGSYEGMDWLNMAVEQNRDRQFIYEYCEANCTACESITVI